jgi:penicillin-binding protein 1C
MKSYNFWPSDVLQAYARAGIYLRKPPEFKENCSTVDIFNQGNPPQILLPTDGTRFLLRSHQLEHEKISLKASVDADAAKVFWFINNKLVGETTAGQILEAKPDIGINEIKAVDNLGRMTTIKITSTLID